jgi:citrate synthase
MPIVKGLADVIFTQTEISHPDSDNSNLIYRGYSIDDLVKGNASFEEVAHLILYGHLPSEQELATFVGQLVANRTLPEPIYAWLRGLPEHVVPMTVLRTAVSMLANYDPAIEDITIPTTLRKAIRLIAQFPMICAAFQRIRDGHEVIAPDPKLGHAANILYMLNGKTPDPDFVRAMNAYLVMLTDHSMNNSTFTARTVASAQADLHSAVTAALASLKGPLHGGANEATMKLLLEIGDESKVDSWVDRAFETKRIIMGFGHRIYKQGDPRARHLNLLAAEMGQKVGALKYYTMSRMVEQAVLRHREIYPNVDFYSASMMYYVGIPIDLFTPMFACARIAGWSAHVIEQYKDAALVRPKSEYIGPRGLAYPPLS